MKVNKNVENMGKICWVKGMEGIGCDEVGCREFMAEQVLLALKANQFKHFGQLWELQHW